MPVINIKSLPVHDRISIAEILRRLNLQIASVIGCEPEHVWSYWEFIDSGHYSVGGNVAAEIHKETHSPIITIRGHEGYPQQKIEAMLETAARVISTELSIDFGNVFASFEELKTGRIFDGGALR
jgi:phenylpyruvate tautomerase PptA (4-oxalocrotonate tautomerase family)